MNSENIKRMSNKEISDIAIYFSSDAYIVHVCLFIDINALRRIVS